MSGSSPSFAEGLEHGSSVHAGNCSSQKDMVAWLTKSGSSVTWKYTALVKADLSIFFKGQKWDLLKGQKLIYYLQGRNIQQIPVISIYVEYHSCFRCCYFSSVFLY